MGMNKEQLELALKLAKDHLFFMGRVVRETENLTRPVPDGHWRWADVKSSGYGKKSEEELTADRERAAERLKSYTTERDVTRSLIDYLEAEAYPFKKESAE